MLIDSTHFNGIVLLAGLVIAILVAIIFGKLLKNTSIGIGLGLLLGIITAALLWSPLSQRVYIVKSLYTYEAKIILGSSSYTLSNGTEVSLQVPSSTCMIVNDSKDDLVIEKVFYGVMNFGGKNNDSKIPSQSTFQLDASTVDYFPYQTAPATIEEAEGTFIAVKWHLRTLSDYEEEYGNAF